MTEEVNVSVVYFKETERRQKETYHLDFYMNKNL